MTRGTLILIGVMLVLMAGTIWASTVGLWLPQPDKEPVSIREGSARPLGSGHHSTRYFVGGGIFGGK